jgi:hypothetical protein
MLVRHHAQGKFYTIECPEGTRAVRRSGGGPDLIDHLLVPLDGEMVRMPADPPELLPMLAETGNFGVRLAGDPVPDVWLAGAVCPGCGTGDVAWLQAEYPSGAVHCDYCGADFALPAEVESVDTAPRPADRTA